MFLENNELSTCKEAETTADSEKWQEAMKKRIGLHVRKTSMRLG